MTQEQKRSFLTGPKTAYFKSKAIIIHHSKRSLLSAVSDPFLDNLLCVIKTKAAFLVVSL